MCGAVFELARLRMQAVSRVRRTASVARRGGVRGFYRTVRLLARS